MSENETRIAADRCDPNDPGTTVEVSFGFGHEAIQVHFPDVQEHHTAVVLLQAWLCRLRGVGVEIAPLDGSIDVTVQPEWLEYFSGLGEDGRRSWAQRYDEVYLDFGQDNYYLRDKDAIQSLATKEGHSAPVGKFWEVYDTLQEDKVNKSKATGVGRFLAEYTASTPTPTDQVESSSPEWYAQRALRLHT